MDRLSGDCWEVRRYACLDGFEGVHSAPLPVLECWFDECTAEFSANIDSKADGGKIPSGGVLL